MGDPVSTQLIVKAVSMGAQMALTATNRIEGPRLDSLKVSTASYGTPLEWFRGVVKLDGRPIIHAEDLHEKKETSKTKGGKYDEYKYDGTWAVAICSHPIAAVRRAWMDGKLVYQAKDIGPRAPVLNLFDGPGLIDKLGFRNFRLYLGGEDQQPDHRIEAFFLNRDGPGTTPAFRGTSYMMFETIPLEKFGNRIPTVDIEAVTELEPEYPYESIATTAGSGSLFSFDPAGGWMAYELAGTGGRLEWYDVANRTHVGASPSPGFLSNTRPSLAADGTAYQVGAILPTADRYLAVTAPFSLPALLLTDAPTFSLSCTRVLENLAGRHVMTAYATNSGYLSYTTHIADTLSARDFCLNGDGEVCILLHPTGASSDFTIRVDGVAHVITGTSRSGPTTAYMMHVAYYGHYLVITDGHYYLVDDTTFTVKATGTAPFTDAIARNNGEQNPSLTALYNRLVKYSLEDLSIVQDDSAHWTFGGAGNWGYDSVSHALWTRGVSTGNPINIAYFDRIGGPGVLLGTIAGDICTDCGIVDANTAALDQLVAGFKTQPSTGKDALGRLLEIYDSEVRPHGFGIQFIKRGAEPATTIDLSEFARSEGEKRYQAAEAPDKNLPRRQTVSFADITKDHQTNTLVSQRPLASTDAVGVSPLDMGDLVATPDEAQRLSDRRLRRVWVDRFSVDNVLSWIHGAIEPGDAHFLNLGDVVRSVRLDRQTFSNDRITCEWKFDFPGAAILSDRAGPTMDNRDEQPIYISGPTRGWVLDIPYLNDGEVAQSPLLHYGAGDYDVPSPWAGADFYDADLDNNEFIAWQHVEPNQNATWGLCSGALGAVDPWCWDRGSVLNVNTNEQLFAASEADLLADASVNQALVGGENGWEVVQFAGVTLESDGTYTLRNFLRGRRGTEGAVGVHVNGETLIMTASLLTDAAALDVVGLDLDFKVTSTGRSVGAAPVMSIAPFTGASLKPYAPASVKKVYNGTDWTFTIVRRTRVGGRWVGGAAIPLAENSEAYQIEVLNGSAVVRTIEVSGTNVATYTAVQMVADFGSAQTSLALRAYQLSDAVGRGFALAA